MKTLFFIVIFSLILSSSVGAQSYSLQSPNGSITVQLTTGKSLLYSIQYKNQPLVHSSLIAMQIADEQMIGTNPRVISSSKTSIQQTIFPPVRQKRAEIPDNYNQLILKFDNRFEIQFRAYDDGVAYRFVSDRAGELTVNNEVAEFHFATGTQIYYGKVSAREDADIFHSSFEEPYSVSALDSMAENILAYSPVLLNQLGLPKVLITESDVNEYPGMFLVKGDSASIRGKFAAYPKKEIISGSEFKLKTVSERENFIAKTIGSRTFPWRVIGIAPTDADLLINDLVYRLAPAPAFSDFSWINPGKSTEEWITALNLYDVDFEAGLNTTTYKYYIDFAHRFGFEYVMLDAGWSDVNNLFEITPGMDMEEITSYAKQKGIGLILWTQALTMEKQMEQAFEQFKKWGIKVIMTDFIDRDDQKAIRLMHRFAAECANNKFMCMIHGAPPSKGFSRTYPNMLTREGVLGSEYNIWSAKANPEHNLLLPFIRQAAGPMDYEPGLLQHATKSQTAKLGFEKVIAQGTRMHQIAMFVVYESPLQLFSGNLSDAIREPELLDFLGKIPTVWDETIILNAELGKYIVEVRRNGEEWFLAAMNNWDVVEFDIPLDFLEEGSYQAEIASDGINAAKNPKDFKLTVSKLSPNGKLNIKLAPGGGFVARIKK